MIPVTTFRLMSSQGARRRLSVATIVAAGTLATTALGAVAASASTSTHATAYHQINLVSDQRG